MKLYIFLTLLLIVRFASTDRTIKQTISGSKGSILREVITTKVAELNSAPDDEDIFVINQKSKLDLIGGDIMQHKVPRSGIVDDTMYWLNNKVPVEYSDSIGMLARYGIDEARLEYEMRTCMRFPDRNGEEDYIWFDPQSGCWSSVGRQGGKQTISIGSGCEKKGTIQHEMLHALGFYHQQSRTDRDDYIKIMTENIGDGHLHNFNTYDYDVINEHRVPYDYNSVMHYSDSGFSTNGEKTIVTLDPAFQDVIGQRRTFSVGDVTMVNRMYPCADPPRISDSCDFEAENICGYVQEVDDEADFEVIRLNEGKYFNPSTDSSFGSEMTGSFMLFNSSVSKANDKAVMRTMRMRTNQNVQCLQFSYYMDLESSSDSELSVYLAQIDEVNGEILSERLLTNLKGDHGSVWNLERLTIENKAMYYKLVFVAKSGGFVNDQIALDDIQVQDKPCETNYFKIQDFSSLIQSTTKGEGVYSPLLYTDEGYAFQLLFYPNGASSSYDGYVGLYYAVAQGSNDDSLTWPFENRVIKMSVVDQSKDVMTSMNQFSQFLTTNGKGSWEKPTSSRNSFYGYSNFMPLSDITNTREFMKNDAVVISINVRNMEKSSRTNHKTLFGNSHENENDKFPGHHNQPEVNINVIKESNETSTDGMMTIGASIGLALTCTFLTLFAMIVVVIALNSSHKRAIKSITFLHKRAETGSQHNYAYDERKI